MQKYRVLIHGENLLTEVDSVPQKLGFFTNVFIEAFTAADAESRAIEIVRASARLADIRLNQDDDPVKLLVDEVHDIDSFDDNKSRHLVFFFHPPSET